MTTAHLLTFVSAEEQWSARVTYVFNGSSSSYQGQGCGIFSAKAFLALSQRLPLLGLMFKSHPSHLSIDLVNKCFEKYHM